MIHLISPAKSLDLEFDGKIPEFTVPSFLDQSEVLIAKLRKLSPAKVGKLMDISEKLAQLNVQRYHDFHTPFTPDNAKPAVMVFDGDVYQGLQARTLDQEKLVFAQQHLRILSGLYGLLRPLDLIQAYRLEMGTVLHVTPAKKNLYQFWGDKITSLINDELRSHKQKTVINLASNEYFKAVNVKKLAGKVVQCDFREMRNGKPVMVTFFAKKARGLMSRFIIDHGIGDVEHLQAFDYDGYLYNKKLSQPQLLVFTRESK